MDYFLVFLGLIKVFCLKIFNPSNFIFHLFPKINFNSRIINKGTITLGKNIRIRSHTYVRTERFGKISIGDNCFFNRNIYMVSNQNISVGNNTIFGPNVVIVDHDHDYRNNKNNYVTKEIVIGSNCWIGANCIILKGVHIGNSVVIAAGTIVTKDIQNNSIIKQKRINVLENSNKSS